MLVLQEECEWCITVQYKWRDSYSPQQKRVNQLFDQLWVQGAWTHRQYVGSPEKSGQASQEVKSMDSKESAYEQALGGRIDSIQWLFGLGSEEKGDTQVSGLDLFVVCCAICQSREPAGVIWQSALKKKKDGNMWDKGKECLA